MKQGKWLMVPALASALASPVARADAPADLVALINGYRSAPGKCQGRSVRAVPPLAVEAALSRVRLRPGTILLAELEQAGYPASKADAVYAGGAEDAQTAFGVLLQSYCPLLLGTGYSAIGASRHGSEWTVVLAKPEPKLSLLLPAQEVAGRAVLAATNAARAQPRDCGDKHFDAAPPLEWDDKLAAAALAHSEDMAAHKYFSHTGRDGKQVDTRARDAGYAWRRVGENIAAGPLLAEDAVAGWVDSPGHCANLMNPGFTEMGAAYAVRGTKRQSAYWTQVFGHR